MRFIIFSKIILEPFANANNFIKTECVEGYVGVY